MIFVIYPLYLTGGYSPCVRRAFLLEKVKLYIDFNKARWQALQWVRKIIIGE